MIAPAIAPTCPAALARWLTQENDSIAAVQAEAPAAAPQPRVPAPKAVPQPAPGADLAPFARTVAELRAASIPRREALVDPWLVTSSLGLISAWRGTGKSMFALELAVSLAAGRAFLGGAVSRARRVLLVDGELPQSDLIARLDALRPGETCGRLRIVSAEELALAGADSIDLARQRDRDRVGAIAAGADMLVLDSVGSLFSGAENDGDEWAPVARWLVSLRHGGVSVILIHNAGYSGHQRGSSRREDALDFSLALEEVEARPEERFGFRATFTKHRSPLPPWNGARIAFSPATGWAVADTKRQTKQARVADYVRQHPDAKPAQIADELAVEPAYVRNVLHRLKAHHGTPQMVRGTFSAPSGGVSPVPAPDPENSPQPSTGAGSEALGFLRQYGVLPSCTSAGCIVTPPPHHSEAMVVGCVHCVTDSDPRAPREHVSSEKRDETCDADPDPEPEPEAVRERFSAQGGGRPQAPQAGSDRGAVAGPGRRRA